MVEFQSPESVFWFFFALFQKRTLGLDRIRKQTRVQGMNLRHPCFPASSPAIDLWVNMTFEGG